MRRLIPPSLSQFARLAAGRSHRRVKSVMADVDRRIPLFFTPFSRQVSESLSRERLLAALRQHSWRVGRCCWPCIWMYGVLSYRRWRRRRNEIGIRMALGATRSLVLRMVLRESALLTVAGLIAGVLGALAAAAWSHVPLWAQRQRFADAGRRGCGAGVGRDCWRHICRRAGRPWLIR